LNSTIPDQSRYCSSPIDLTIPPKIIQKMQNISRIKESKQQEIDEMYVDNIKISEDISAAKTDANNASQELQRQENEISKSADICEQLNESISSKEEKLLELSEQNKSQCEIEKVPEHLQDFVRQIERKRAKLTQKDLKVQALEIEVLQLESKIAGDTYEDIVGIESRKKDQKLSKLEAWLATAREANTEHEENIKDMDKKKSGYYSMQNVKSSAVTNDEVKAVEELEANNMKMIEAIRTLALSVCIKRGIGQNQFEALELCSAFEKSTRLVRIRELKIKKQDQKNAKLMAELTEAKKSFKPKFRDQKAMIQLAQAEKTKKMYVDSIRSLRTIVFNLRKQFNDTTAKAGSRNEPLLRKGLKSMQKMLAVCEANNWQRSYPEQYKAEPMMDPSCDLDAYKWVSLRKAPVKAVMVPDRSSAFSYLNDNRKMVDGERKTTGLRLTHVRNDLRKF